MDVESATPAIEANRILDLINQARGTYDAFPLERLLPGQIRSASFCPLGRSLRVGVEDRVFAAVGTKHLRIWTAGADPAVIATKIMKTWEIPPRRLWKPGEEGSFVILPLRPELIEFVNQFDRGLLPDFQAEPNPAEVLRLEELARTIPSPLLGSRRDRKPTRSIRPMNPSPPQAGPLY